MEKKIQTWEQAVKEYESALKLDSKDGDANYNSSAGGGVRWVDGPGA